MSFKPITMLPFNIGYQSLCVKDDFENNAPHPHSLPIYATSTFVYENMEKAVRAFQGKEQAYIYSRWHNPTIDVVERKIAALETFGLNMKASALLFSSGMAAISSFLMALQLKKNDTIITQGNLYGATTELFQLLSTQYGCKVVYEDLKNLNKIESLIKSNKKVRLLYVESPANPTCDCYDLTTLAAIAKKYHILSCIDNTVATSYLQQPLRYGFDAVVYSATKYFNGHGNALAGAVVGTSENLMKQVWYLRKLTGTISNAFEAFLLYNGIKTLPIRMNVHCANAMTVAQYLEKHPAIARVYYPGLPQHPDHLIAKKHMHAFGGMLSFEIKSKQKSAAAFMKKIRFLTLTASLGTPDTLIQHPASMTHRYVSPSQRKKFGISQNLIRLAVGLENATDIIADLEQALK